MNLVKIVVAEDHVLVRQGVRMMLELEKDMEVVGEAATGTEAIALAASLAPDVIVMDLQMPGDSGLVATRVILNVKPVAHVTAIAVDRQRLTLQQIGDAERNQLLWKVIRTVVVRAMRDEYGKAVCAMPGAHEMIGRRLGRRIR